MLITNWKNTPSITIGELLKKSFGKFTEPSLPFKRELTKEETMLMYKYFKNHSWSDIDANSNILLGGGESSKGIYYITEKDLNFLKSLN